MLPKTRAGERFRCVSAFPTGNARRCLKGLRSRTNWCCRRPLAMACEIITQSFANLWAHKLRSALTMFGISWGVAAIVFMIAIGDGFKIGYRNMLYAMGTDIVIVWSGRTSMQ